MDMTSDKTVTANFTTTNKTLQVNKGGTGGGTVTGDQIDCGSDCEGTYTDGTDVVLSASPDGTSTFAGWTNCDQVDTPTAGQCTMDMTSDKTVTANFTTTNKTLTVTKSGDGDGTVSGPGINCDTSDTDCTEPYAPGTVVTLTAAPDANSSFNGWTNCAPTGGSDNECTVTMDADKTVTADFTCTGDLCVLNSRQQTR